jgi:Pvc16 N-terminal domain
MSASTAIGMVSTSLRNLLVSEMQLNLTVEVTVLAPDEPGGDRRVNLFLYRLEENPYLKNAEPTLHPGPPPMLMPPPLSLELFYLMTAYAPNDALTGNATSHQILGEAMRVFHENAEVPRNVLDAGLLDARERLQIVKRSLDPEELSRIWSTFDQPFRLSVLYQVSTVQLDTLPVRALPAPGRVRQVGVPEIRQPMAPPVVGQLQPQSGPPGTTLTFSGEHLRGWRAGVRFAERPVLDAGPLPGNTFVATVPPDTAPGFYDVRIDVSALFRRIFLFEVTA